MFMLDWTEKFILYINGTCEHFNIIFMKPTI